MLDDKTIKKLPTKEMIRCEVTGKLVPIEECEVVVIRIIKAKDADLNGFNPFGTTKPAVVQENLAKEPVERVDAIPMPDRPMPPMKKIIPAGIMAMMMDPSHPEFETKGAKETRRV